jgi:hypothetical protein
MKGTAPPDLKNLCLIELRLQLAVIDVGNVSGLQASIYRSHSKFFHTSDPTGSAGSCSNRTPSPNYIEGSCRQFFVLDLKTGSWLNPDTAAAHPYS